MIEPAVQLLAEGTEDYLGHLPLDAQPLNMGDEVVYTDDSGTVTYKIEKVRYTAEHHAEPIEGAAARHSVYGRLDYIVSVVP